MPDNILDILIRFGLDKTKANEAAAELRKVGEEAKRTHSTTAAEAEKAEIKTKDLNKANKLLSHELGIIGHYLRYVFNPGILGAAALASAIGKVTDSFFGFMKSLEQSAVNAARGIGDIKQAMLELQIEQIKADTRFKESLAEFERQSTRRITLINLEKEAALQLLEARSNGALPEDKQRMNDAKRGIEATATKQEIAAREESLKGLEKMARGRFSEGFKASNGLGPDRVALDVQNWPKQLQSLNEQIAEQQKVVEEMSAITTWSGAFPYWNDPKGYQEQLATYNNSIATLDKLKRSRSQMFDRQVGLTRAQTAFGAADSLMEKAKSGRADLAAFTADAGAREQTNMQVGAYETGRGGLGELVAAGAAGADAIRGGGRATPQQASAINELVKLLNLQGQTNAQIVNTLSRMNNTQEAFNNSLRSLESRLQSQINRKSL